MSNMGICKKLDGADATDDTVKDNRRLAPTPSIQDLASKTPQGNVVDAGADYSVPYSTTKYSTTRLSGLPAEIEMEADSLKKREGKHGQLPHSHGWEERLSTQEER
jgi:hypothetical protein